MAERERQAELVRLKREKRCAEKEDNFANAAKLVGLAERQQAANNERYEIGIIISSWAQYQVLSGQ